MADKFINATALLEQMPEVPYKGSLRRVLMQAPAADVQPVVRCRECKHGTRLVCDLAGNEYIQCRHGNIAHRLDWFCADGAKEETE